LIPTGGNRHVTSTFWTTKDNLDQRLRAAGAWNSPQDRPVTSLSSRRTDRRAIPVDPPPHLGPRPWLGWITGSRPEKTIAGVRDFVRQAAADGYRFLTSRERPLFALPVVGTGAGGLYSKAGELLEALLPALKEEAADLNVDLALVAFTEPHYAAAQAVRRTSAPSDWWPELDEATCREAIRLGRLAARGQLVIFFGAGISQGAGLPAWGRLLDDLAADGGIDADLRGRLSALGALDYAQAVARRIRSLGKKEGAEVCRLLLPYNRYSLAHAVLASLPVNELITTNYDILFETASRDAGRPLAVLPYAPATDERRWILKMHGCVRHPDDIVLTRESYLRYTERNAALAGIVQAMLITRHMLFLGFSLRDENFHRIVDAVRRALRADDGGATQLLGSAVMLRSEEFLEDLWRDEIDWIKVPDGRFVDIFLDRLGFEASSLAYLLDRRFEALLDAPSRALREILRPVAEARRGPASHSPAWRLVEDLLERLGM
jgi:hypothetical protein